MTEIHATGGSGVTGAYFDNVSFQFAFSGSPCWEWAAASVRCRGFVEFAFVDPVLEYGTDTANPRV